MRKVLNFKELLDNSYNKYKSQKAITIDYDYEKNINYFNYKFDIYSLARALKSSRINIRNKKVAIISENRYEFLVTYLANIILKNTVFVIDSNLSKSAIEKIIKKQNINTLFFSNKNKEKIIDIYKLNVEYRNKNKRKIINLINFDSNNKFPIIDYEKLINIGRYIENYSIDNIIEKIEENILNTVIVDKYGTKLYSEKELLNSAYIIGKSIRLSKKKRIQSVNEIDSFYKIVIYILIPMIYGLNIRYFSTEIDSKMKNIEIEEYSAEKAIIIYKNIQYQIENINGMTKVMRIDKKNSALNKEKEQGEQSFILIKNDKYEKIHRKNRVAVMPK